MKRAPRPGSFAAVGAALMAWNGHTSAAILFLAFAAKNEKGHHVTQLHRRLSEDIGHPALREHLGSVTTMMKLSGTKEIFMDQLDAIHPRVGATIRMSLEYE